MKCLICDLKNAVSGFEHCKKCLKVQILSCETGKKIDINQLCVSCSNILDDPNDKNCPTCMKEILKMQCTWVKEDNIKCTNKAKFGAYCGKHKSYGLVLEDEKNGIIHCVNHIRGCTNKILDNNKYKKCLDCRMSARIIDKKRFIKKVERTELHPDKIIKGVRHRFCRYCPNGGMYKEIALTKNGLRSVKCQDCLAKQRVIEQNRNPRDKIIRKYDDYVANCKKNNKQWLLTKKQAIFLFYQPCFYCNEKPLPPESMSGIDRYCNKDRKYTVGNVVPSCWICNRMKGCHPIKNFISICEHIATYNKLYDGSLFPNLFQFSVNSSYSGYIKDARKRNIQFNLTKEQFNQFANLDCHYCGHKKNRPLIGIDRIDSYKGYDIDNAVSCCKVCNMLKNDLTKECFLNKCLQIVETYYNCKKKLENVFNISNIREELLCEFMSLDNTSINPDELDTSHFMYDTQHYMDKMFIGNLNDVKNIKIELEFVERSDRISRDLWNYYRIVISSLKKSSLQGNQIYILVKDAITQKYLGIISLNSDIYNLGDRDVYIGWDEDKKKKNLKYIMNMSTCVPLDPFGFNYCGGKLLASLVFSREVSEYFYKKYNRPLLAICTTSLYGKSIQYSKLPYLSLAGFTTGFGTVHIPETLYQKCLNYLDLIGVDTLNIGHPSSRKMRKICKVLADIGIPKNQIIFHGQRKGIYFGYIHDTSKSLLNNSDIGSVNWSNNNLNKYNINYTELDSAQDIFDWWYSRYAIRRYNNLRKDNRFRKKITIKIIPRGKHNLQQREYINKKKAELGEDVVRQQNRDYMREYRNSGIKIINESEEINKQKPVVKKNIIDETDDQINKQNPIVTKIIIDEANKQKTLIQKINKTETSFRKYNQQIVDDILDYKKRTVKYTYEYISDVLSKKHGIHVHRNFIAKVFKQ